MARSTTTASTQHSTRGPDPAQDVDAAEMAVRLRLLVTRLTRMLRHQDEGDLAPTLRSALATIDREGPLTLGDLAQREHVAPPTITKAVDKLQTMGFVTRRQDDADRRVAWAQITPAGKRHVAKNRSRRTAWLATRLEDLTEDELQRLAAAADVLERLVAPQGDEAR
jgi:DNA-binding MarR family transcriptional regulator